MARHNPAINTQNPPAAWHALALPQVCEQLQSPLTGLTAEQARQRLQRDGYNRIVSQQRNGIARMLLNQFTDFMILVLLVAAVVSGIVGEPSDTATIVVIILLNAVVGFVQEYRAEKALQALQQLAMPTCQVMRDGQPQSIASDELVTGDVVLLEAGNLVPADMRLLELSDLWVDEAALTGESVPVAKATGELAAQTTLAERSNMLFKGTLVGKGRAQAVVVATGMATELGRIASLLQQQHKLKSPLQHRLEGFGRRLALVILGLCVLIFVAGLLRGEPVLLMLLTAISLAVAAIPEALPAVVTIALALGAKRMVRQQALIRRLPAAETLGSVTYICSDKTGTLTQNRMHVERYWLHGRAYEALPQEPLAQTLLQAMALNNDVTENGGSQPAGEPTELALYQAAAENINPVQLRQHHPREAELAFDSERKRMTTLHRRAEGYIAFSKGAPEVILPCCNRQWRQGEQALLDDAGRQQLLQQAHQLAGQGFRVLAFAERHWQQLPAMDDAAAVESGLCFIGFVALMDPPRPQAFDAVAMCRQAGITPVMITGDHPATALAIAERLGICEPGAQVLSGVDLERLSAAQRLKAATEVRVYARVTPDQKIQIVEALQQQGEFVAMTGDGVNDAPALKRADIGVAMGQNGTDVAREAADMVLLDDNFATIVAAVREGRRIYDNIRKFIRYTMTSNAGEIWTLSLAPLFGLPLPLLPIHILWINLVTDGLPGLALSAERAEPGVMQRPPRPPQESLFARGMWIGVIWVGVLIGGLSIGAQAWAYHTGSANWQTMVFMVLTLSQLMNALVVRSERQSLFTLGLFSNRYLLGAVLLTLVLQLLVVYWPPAQQVFKTSALTPQELLICLLLPLVILLATELEKWVIRRRNPLSG